MVDVDKYLAELHEDVKRKYNWDKNENIRNCITIAVDFSDILIENNEHPYFMMFDNNLNKLYMKIWPVSHWSKHVVAVNRNLVYDPIHAVPIELTEYRNKTFQEGKIEHIHIFTNKEFRVMWQRIIDSHYVHMQRKPL